MAKKNYVSVDLDFLENSIANLKDIDILGLIKTEQGESYAFNGSPQEAATSADHIIATEDSVWIKTDARTANTVLAGPASGNSAAATFRSLVAADIPSIPSSKISDLNTTLATALATYYTKTEVDNIVDDYLPLAGGTMTGAIRWGNAEFINDFGGNLFLASPTLFVFSNNSIVRATEEDGDFGPAYTIYDNSNLTFDNSNNLLSITAGSNVYTAAGTGYVSNAISTALADYTPTADFKSLGIVANNSPALGDAAFVTYSPTSALKLWFTRGNDGISVGTSTSGRINQIQISHATGGANTTISDSAGKVLSAIAVNSYGHVTSVSSKTLAAADIPTLAISKISGLQSALDAKADDTDLNNYLDLAGTHTMTGKIQWSDSSIIGPNSTTGTFDFDIVGNIRFIADRGTTDFDVNAVDINLNGDVYINNHNLYRYISGNPDQQYTVLDTGNLPALWGNTIQNNLAAINGPLTFAPVTTASTTAHLEVITINVNGTPTQFLHTRLPFYSDGDISAFGANGTSGGGGGDGKIQTVYTTSDFGTIGSSHQAYETETFNAYAVDTLYNRLVTAEGDIDSLETAIGSLVGFEARVVTSLPQTGEVGIIYLVSHTHGTGDVYDEYIWVSSTSSYEKIGNTDIDLSQYINSVDFASGSSAGTGKAITNFTKNNNSLTFTTGTFLTSHQSLDGYVKYLVSVGGAAGKYVSDVTKDGSTLSVSFTDFPTSLAGYGIQDSIPIIDTQDNGTSADGTWKAKTTPASLITAYTDGMMIRYKLTYAGASTTTLNVNGLGAKTVYRRGTSKLTTQYGVGSYLILYYSTSFDSGSWQVLTDYDANTTYSIISDSELQTGTATTGRTISAARLAANYYISNGTVHIAGNSITPLTADSNLSWNKLNVPTNVANLAQVTVPTTGAKNRYVYDATNQIWTFDNADYLTTSAASSTYQPINGILTSLSNITSQSPGMIAVDSNGNISTVTTSSIAHFETEGTDYVSISLNGTSKNVLKQHQDLSAYLQKSALNIIDAGSSTGEYISGLSWSSSNADLSVTRGSLSNYLQKSGGTMTGAITFDGDENYIYINLLQGDHGYIGGDDSGDGLFIGTTYGEPLTIQTAGNDINIQTSGVNGNGNIALWAGQGSSAGDIELTGASLTFNGNSLLTESVASSTYLSKTDAASTYQPLDADLTAIAGLTGTSGLLKKTAANTWSLDTSTYLTTSAASSTYLPLAGGTMANATTATIKWAQNTWNTTDGWDTWNGQSNTGLAILTSSVTGTGAPSRYAVGLHVGGYYGMQIAVNTDGNMYYRYTKTTPDAWKQLLTTTSASNTYLPLAGGTLTGPLHIKTTSNNAMSGTDGYIDFTDGSSTTYARIGTNTNGTIALYGSGNIYFRPNDVVGEFSSSNGVYISPTTFTYNGNNVVLAETDQNISGTKSFTGGLVNIYTATSGSPSLWFRRGTTSDSYVDWRIMSSGGGLYFDYSVSGTNTTVAWMGRTTIDSVTHPYLRILGASTAEVPELVLARGTISDANVDWKIQNDSGGLKFVRSISGTDTIKTVMNSTQFYPDTTEEMSLGGSNNRWLNVYSVNANLTGTLTVDAISASSGLFADSLSIGSSSASATAFEVYGPSTFNDDITIAYGKKIKFAKSSSSATPIELYCDTAGVLHTNDTFTSEKDISGFTAAGSTGGTTTFINAVVVPELPVNPDADTLYLIPE